MNKTGRRVPIWLVAVLTLLKNECRTHEHCVDCPIMEVFGGNCLLDAANFPSQWALPEMQEAGDGN